MGMWWERYLLTSLGGLGTYCLSPGRGSFWQRQAGRQMDRQASRGLTDELRQWRYIKY
jgi:hypothetical protein